MNQSTTTPIFSDDAPIDEQETAPLRISGFLTLILGVLSSTALTSPNLVFLPVLAIVTGLIALRPTGIPGVRPVGRTPAILGIVLAFFFASWAITFFSIRYQKLTTAAETLALDWLELLNNGEKELAFELSKPAAMRQVGGMALPDFYSELNRDAFIQLDGFTSFPVVSAVLAAPKKPQWVYDGTQTIFRQFGHENVVLKFRDKTSSLGPIYVTMCRSPKLNDEGEYDLDAPREWFAKSVAFVEER
jgi:hypothetical protein